MFVDFQKKVLLLRCVDHLARIVECLVKNLILLLRQTIFLNVSHRVQVIFARRLRFLGGLGSARLLMSLPAAHDCKRLLSLGCTACGRKV